MYHVPEHNMRVFDSITEMALWADENQDKVDYHLTMSAGKFTNHQDWATVKARCAMGYDNSVDAARKLMGQLECSIDVSAPTLEQNVAGFFPNVADYISGEPECMWDVPSTDSDTAPLSIYVDLTCSEGITAQQIHKRGVAVLALTMALSMARPVSLYVCTVMGTVLDETPQQAKRGDNYSATIVRIETAPLDLARAAYVMTDVGVARRLFYAVGNINGQWPKFDGCKLGDGNYGKTTSPAYISRVREILGADSNALYIPAVSGYLNKEALMMCERPVEWLNAKLQQLGGVTAQA